MRTLKRELMHKLHLTDLDELLENNHNSVSKIHLQEAITTYRAGAYRVAIISVWISVCVDLIEKIKELEINGELEAIATIKRLNNIGPDRVKEMLSFENDLLEIAYEKFKFISLIEKTHLERLKQDRNICAHPNFSVENIQFNPSAELVRSYIVQASEYLLSSAPVQGKVIVNQVFDLICSETFPSDEEKAFIVLSSDNYLGKIKNTAIKNLIIILLIRLFTDETKGKISLIDRISSAMNAISRINPEVFKTVIDEKLNIILSKSTTLPTTLCQKRALIFFSNRLELCSKLDEPNTILLENVIESMGQEALIKYRVSKLAQNGFLEDIVMNKLEQYSRIEQIKWLESSSSKIFKDKAIDLFITSKSFSATSKIGNNILVPHLKYCNPSDLKIILDGIINNSGMAGINQITDANGIDEIICEIFKYFYPNQNNDKAIWVDFYDEVKDDDMDEFIQLLKNNNIINVS